jgi:uridine kinase
LKRSELLDQLAGRISQVERAHPVRVAIDGPDAAGKTMLADELVAPLQAYGQKVIRASVDGFHNPAEMRYARGRGSASGYYYDSFNYGSVIESLLAPLGPDGSRRYRTATYDYRVDAPVEVPVQTPPSNAILLFDGVFLLRPELKEFWDFSIFVDVSIETVLARAEKRDALVLGGAVEVRRLYEERYLPGQKLYFDQCRPKERAAIVIDNNDPEDAVVKTCSHAAQSA